MVQLESRRGEFAAIGVNVAGMTYDDQALLKAFHTEAQLGYPLLQDVDVYHIDGFGIRNMDFEPASRGYGVPHPGIVFLRPDGTIGAKFAVPGYRDRPPLDDVLAAVAAAAEN